MALALVQENCQKKSAHISVWYRLKGVVTASLNVGAAHITVYLFRGHGSLAGKETPSLFYVDHICVYLFI